MAVALSPSRRRWDDGIPPVLRPLVRAYLLGYASSVAPRLLTLLLQHVTRRKRDGQAAGRHAEPLLAAVRRILRGGLDWQRFPTFCAALVGGSTLLEVSICLLFCCPLPVFGPCVSRRHTLLRPAWYLGTYLPT